MLIHIQFKDFKMPIDNEIVKQINGSKKSTQIFTSNYF